MAARHFSQTFWRTNLGVIAMGKFIDLPAALQPYAILPIWVVWKREPSSKASSKFTKVPYRAQIRATKPGATIRRPGRRSTWR